MYSKTHIKLSYICHRSLCPWCIKSRSIWNANINIYVTLNSTNTGEFTCWIKSFYCLSAVGKHSSKTGINSPLVFYRWHASFSLNTKNHFYVAHKIDAFSKFKEATLLSKKCWKDGKFGHGMTWLVRKLHICENDLEVWWGGNALCSQWFVISLPPAPSTRDPLKVDWWFTQTC